MGCSFKNVYEIVPLFYVIQVRGLYVAQFNGWPEINELFLLAFIDVLE